MHPIIQHELASAGIAGLHSQATHNQLAQAPCGARRVQRDRGHCSLGGSPATQLARWLYAVLPVRPIARSRLA